MRKNHMTMCLAGIAAAVVLLLAFGVRASTRLVVGVVLLCPLMMFVMMKSMTGGSSQGVAQDVKDNPRSDHPAGKS